MSRSKLSLNIKNINAFILVLFLTLGLESLVFSKKAQMRKFAHSLSNLDKYEAYANEELILNHNSNNNIFFKNTENRNLKINSINSIVTLDISKNSCDVDVIERINFSFLKPQKTLQYVVISKKIPYYGLNVKLNSEVNPYKVNLTNKLIHRDSSFRQKIYEDDSGRKLIFREKWLNTLNFDRP